MLQQTQVNTVIPFYNFHENFPDIAAPQTQPKMRCSTSDGFGLLRQSRNLHRCATGLRSAWGRFPTNLAELGTARH